MTLKLLRDLIRFEAGMDGTDTLVGFINRVINEELIKRTQMHMYPELFVLNATVAAVASDNTSFALPTGLQHFLQDSIRYSIGGDLTNALSLFRGPFGLWADGTPLRYIRVGNSITVWPNDVVFGDAIFLDYYREPTELVADADEFPIPSLLETVKLASIARLSRISPSDKSRDFREEAAEAYSASRAVLE